MPRLLTPLHICVFLSLTGFAAVPTAHAAEAILPVKVQIISYEKWQKDLQEQDLETQTEATTSTTTSHLFARMDIDGNEAITVTEYLERGGRRATEDSFYTLDLDQNGLLSRDELEGFFAL